MERIHYNALQLEVKPLWTCGPPLSEAKGILQAGFLSCEMPLLRSHDSVKKTARSNAFFLGREACLSPSCKSPLASCTDNFDSLLHMRRLCSLPFAVCHGIYLSRIYSGIQWIGDYCSFIQGQVLI